MCLIRQYAYSVPAPLVHHRTLTSFLLSLLLRPRSPLASPCPAYMSTPHTDCRHAAVLLACLLASLQSSPCSPDELAAAAATAPGGGPKAMDFEEEDEGEDEDEDEDEDEGEG